MFGYRHTHTDSACITSMWSSAYIHVRNNNIDFRYILYTVLFLNKDMHTQPVTSHDLNFKCHMSRSVFVLNDIGDIVDQNYLIFLFIKYR